MQTARIRQIKEMAYDTVYLKSRLEENRSTLPFLTRAKFQEYMNPDLKLGFPIGYLPEDQWVKGQSGGTTNGPVITRTALKDSLSTAFQTARNLKFWLGKLGFRDRLWSLIPNRPIYSSEFKRAGFVFFEGKALDKKAMFAKIKKYLPNIIMGTAYSVTKQLKMLSDLQSEVPETQEFIVGLQAAIYGGEFMAKEQQQQIQSLFPNIKLISRYINSQTGYGIIGLGLPFLETEHLHILDEGMCKTVIVDEHLREIADGAWGEVAVVNLHMIHQPVLGVCLGDEGRILRTREGKRLIELRGRVDDIIVLNTQKIYARPILETAVEAVKDLLPGSQPTGISQLIKKSGQNIVFKIETKNATSQIKITEELAGKFSEKIMQSVKKVARSMNLPEERSIENLNVKLEILPEEGIERVGVRQKVRVVLNEES
jgi:phenylacetate-coenzyme A ligase PaaK-like adenylate-forming protein